MKKLLLAASLWLTVLGVQAQSKTTGAVTLGSSGNGMTAQLDLNSATSTATLTFTGPSDRWFALQFGSFANGGGMQSGADMVYSNGTTLVDCHMSGIGVTPSTDTNNWTVTSNTIASGVRTIVATRAFSTGSGDDYTFVYSNTDIDFAWAKSSSASNSLANHGSNRGYALNKTFTCVAPAAPTAAAQTFCNGATVANLAATGGTGATFKWYSAATGGTSLATTTALATGTYYVSQTIGDCESTRQSVAVTVTTVAQPGGATAQSFCDGSTVASLAATASGGGTLAWYTAATGGSALASTTVLASGSYYVSQTVGDCTSTRKQVTVTVAPLAQPTAAAQSFCDGSTVASLVATGQNGATIKWYAAATGGSPLAGTTALSSGNYYVSQTAGPCESPRLAVAVTVAPLAQPTAPSAQQTCTGATIADLTVTGATGATVSWYAAATGGSPLAGTTVLTETTYYVAQTLGACESTRKPIVVTFGVVAVPTVTETAQTLCSTELVEDIEAEAANGAELNFYATENGAPLNEETVITAGTYYVSQTLNGCESTKVAITVTVTPAPAAPGGNAVQQFEAGETIADAFQISVVIGSEITWYVLEDGDLEEIDTDTVLQDGVVYFVTQTTNDCESETLAITADEVLGTDDFTLDNLVVYPNPVADVITVSNKSTLAGVAVLNLLGQQVLYQSANENKVQLNVSQLSAGTYILKVNTEDGRSGTVRIVKK